MPRKLKSDKFFIYAVKKSGDFKGKRMLGVNHTYKGGFSNITLQDLIDFLKVNNVEVSNVELPAHFITFAKE